MNRCERCQPLILDHLYGLLDGPDEALVEAHLRDCATCAAARDEAARVQGMFAKAARGAFPHVRFDAPAKDSGTPLATPAVQPLTMRRSARVAVWLPWAVAAAVMIAIPGTVLPVLGVLNRAKSANEDVNNSLARLTPMIGEVDKARQAIDEPRDAARREFAARTQSLDNVLSGWVNAEKMNLTQARKTPVDVLKPASVQPGAPNEFHLSIRDGSALGQGQLLAEIHEIRGGDKQSDAVIYSQTLKSQHLEAQPLRLPAQVWSKLQPQSELFLAVSSLDPMTGAKTEIQDRVRLMGPVFATMLVTDKPAYRPGETLHFRSLTLDRVSFRPPEREQVFEFDLYDQAAVRKVSLGRLAFGGTDLVRLSEGKVAPVLVDGKPIHGVGCGSFPLPENLAEGDYTLVLRELPHPAGYPPAVPVPVVRPIKIRSTPPDDFRKRTGYRAASYSAGDTVEAWAELMFQDKPVAGAEVEAIATADSVVFESIQLQRATGTDGRVNLRFTLPKELERGDVRLKVTFKAKQGKDVLQETVTERVPVVGRNVVIEFFPEGGTLVAGMPCRVYFRATTPNGQPMDIKGTLTDGRRALAKVETVTDAAEGANRGIGSFTYTPAIDTPVWLKLESPIGMHAPVIVPNDRSFPVAASAVAGLPAASSARTGFVLPIPKSEGVVMTVLDPVTAPGQPIRVHLRSVGATRKLVVGAYTRGRLSDTKSITAEPNQVSEVVLMTNPDPRGGVVRITVFEASLDEAEARAEGAEGLKPDMKPVAERLVFRKPGESLNLSFTTPPGRKAGDATELGITATDEKGKPTAAILYAAAVNTGVAPGPKDRLLTTHFLIAGEINTPDAMEYADFLLTDHPKAGEVLDLVLATQGWRRFAEQTPCGYIKRPTAPSLECANLLVTNGQYTVWTDPAAIRDRRKLHETYWPKYEAAKKARDEAQAALAAANVDRSVETRARELAANVEQARDEARVLVERADAAAQPVARFHRAGWYGVAGFGLLALLLGAVCFARPATRLPLGISTFGALGLVAFLIFALGTAEQTRAAVAIGPEPARFAANAVEPHRDLAPMPGEGAIQNEPDARFDFSKGGVTKAKGPGPKTVAGTQNAGDAGQPLPAMFPRDTKENWHATPFPTLPKVDSGRAGKAAFGPPGGGLGSGGGMGGVGLGFGGGMGGGTGMGGYWGGFLPPFGPYSKMLPAAPSPSSGAGVASGGTTVAPTPAPPGGAIAPGIVEKVDRLGARTIIPLEEPERLYERRTENGARLYGPPVPPAFGTLGRASDAKKRADDTFSESTHHARLFAQTRAHLATELMLEALARKQSVPLDAVRQAVERVKKGEGWVPQQQGLPTTQFGLTPEEAKAYFRLEQTMPKVPPLVVREYAAPRPGSTDDEVDSPDTVLWQPVIVLPSDGKTKIPFYLGNAPGGYQVVIAGHTLDGRIGAVRRVIPVAQPESLKQSATPAPGAPIPPPKP